MNVKKQNKQNQKVYYHHKINIQAFLNFRSYDSLNFWFNAFYDSILFSSPLVLLSNLDLRGFRFRQFYDVSPH